MKNQIVINGIDYILDSEKLRERIQEAVAEYGKTHTEKRDFWKELSINTGLLRSTIQGWYNEGRVPRNTGDLKKLMEYLGGDWPPVLTPISTCTEIEDDNTKAKFLELISQSKELGINSYFLAVFVGKVYGDDYSLYSWFMMKKGRIIPSKEIVEHVDQVVAIIKHNSAVPKKKVKFFKNRTRNGYAARIRHVGMDAIFVWKYFRLICNFEVTFWQVLRFVCERLSADEEFESAFLFLIEKAEKAFVDYYFPVEAREGNVIPQMRRNKNYKLTSAIVIIYTLPGEGIFERIIQRHRIRQYAKNNEIRLDESFSSITADSSWYDLKNAVGKVEMGFCDAVILVSSSKILNCELADKFRLYTYENGVPVIYLDEAYYL